jgi:hypothetical protein
VSTVQSSSSSSSSAAAAAAAAAFAKSLSILTSGFAVVRASGAGHMHVTIDTTQHGDQFAMMLLSICGISGGSNSSTTTSVASLVNQLQSVLLTCRDSLWDSTVLRLTRASALISNVMSGPLPPSASSLSLISLIMTGSSNVTSSGSMSSSDCLRLLWMLYTPLLPVAGLNCTPMYNHIRSRDAALSVVRFASCCCCCCCCCFFVLCDSFLPQRPLPHAASACRCCGVCRGRYMSE